VICFSMPLITHTVEQIAIGNFALPSAQQPGPLFSFGQNIVDKYDIQGAWNPEFIKGKHQYIFANNLTFLYGITKASSLFLTIPVPALNKQNKLHSSGLGDITVQGEYAFFNQGTETDSAMASLVANIGLPIGSSKKNPPTGFG